MIKRAESDVEIQKTFLVMNQLRPFLTPDTYVARIRDLMSTQGFRLAFLESDGGVQAVAGYRIQDMLYCGKFLSIDDLVTNEASRSMGFGAQVLDWLVEEARQEGCTQIELLSSTAREGAHRFYFRNGFTIDAFHFRWKL
ncbi:GNAT family N-acetyltransferase [Asticcacaulis sp.]|uniref:GNAT family N-acetyltransferase n=1 Tax=Asticcacaulis sp. TaxID=1872648 RepID=UPI003F7C9CFD